MSLKAAYGQLARVNSFSALRQAVPILPIWDDHDYGLNDAGGDWPRKQTAESLYEFVWDIRADDSRAQREGVYFASNIGPEGRRVQVIFLDTRYFRTPLTRNNTDSFGEYLPSNDPRQNMLGDDQWQWFEQHLREPADFGLIDIEWETGDIFLQLRDKNSETVRELSINLKELKKLHCIPSYEVERLFTWSDLRDATTADER